VSLPLSNPPHSEAEQIESLKKQLQLAEWKIRVLEEQLRLERIKKYGPKSERLSDAQLELLDLEPGVSRAEVEAEGRREPLPGSVTPGATRSNGSRHPGRQQLPKDLPRIERLIRCGPEQCLCKACGQQTVVIGYEESEQLDVEPARYFVALTRREKRACRSCSEGSVSAAPLPARIIDKGLASDRVVIDTIVGKYSDHLPLYRQSIMLERETGITISRATMDGWVMRTGDLLTPVVEVMKRELVASNYVQADETPVPVQMHDGRGKNHQAYLWQYSQPRGVVIFDFQLGRGREGPRKFLSGFKGILQTDGYAAYESALSETVVHAACWAHARRKAFEAVKLNPEDRRAGQLVARIDELFSIDAEARKAGMDQAARHALRLESSRPLLQVIRQELESARATVLPASALGKAVNYTLSLWPKLTRFLEYPELELSTNLAENSMRPVVLGRKNWIHVGSQEAGPRVAAILSIVETCRRLKLSLRDYLTAVLPGLAKMSIQRIHACTPATWAASRF
jgi:transposase